MPRAAWLSMVGLALVGVCAALPVYAGTVVYSNDFQSGSPGDTLGSEWSSNTRINETPSGELFLGGALDPGFPFSLYTRGLGQETATLTLEGLDSHTQVTVTFDLYIISSWGGTGGPADCNGPDIWQLTADGTVLVDTTFSQFSDCNQNYPDSQASGITHAGPTGTAAQDTLAYADGGGDSTYRVSVTFSHTASSLTLAFIGMANEGLGNESWGVDNLTVEIEGVPSLTLAGPFPGLAGMDNSFDVTGATPGATIRLFGGSQGGLTQVSRRCPGVMLEIMNPGSLGSAVADGSGHAVVARFFPGRLSGHTRLFQAIDLLACTVSNLESYTFP